jgi:hypothetical protein
VERAEALLGAEGLGGDVVIVRMRGGCVGGHDLSLEQFFLGEITDFALQ